MRVYKIDIYNDDIKVIWCRVIGEINKSYHHLWEEIKGDKFIHSGVHYLKHELTNTIFIFNRWNSVDNACNGYHRHKSIKDTANWICDIISANKSEHMDYHSIPVKAGTEYLNTLYKQRAESLFGSIDPKKYSIEYKGDFIGGPYIQVPQIQQVLSHDPATIIFWKDGTKTVVKAHDGDEYDIEKGILYGIIRKVYGEGRNYTKILDIIYTSSKTFKEAQNGQ